MIRIPHLSLNEALLRKATSEQTKRRRENDRRTAAIDAQTTSVPNEGLTTGESPAVIGVWLDKFYPYNVMRSHEQDILSLAMPWSNAGDLEPPL